MSTRRKRDIFGSWTRKSISSRQDLDRPTKPNGNRSQAFADDSPAPISPPTSPDAAVKALSPIVTSPPDDDTTDSLYDEALGKLPAAQRLLISQHSRSKSALIGEAYTAAVQHKQLCEERRWKWTFKGQEIILAEVASKVVIWLDKFKALGDIVAGVEPVHAGIPWAGVLLILNTLVADSKQMGILLIGMDLTLAMSHRLEAYAAFYASLPMHISTSNLRSALVNLYVRILSFLASAIETYKKNTAIRILEALWKPSDLINVEADYDKLGARAEIEASNSDRHLQSQRWEILHASLRSLDGMAGVHQQMKNLSVKADLSALITAKGATYDSFEEEHLAYCMEGTRVDILESIDMWSKNITDKTVFWLCGMAGTGKSTIARTVCAELDTGSSHRLGASFFFKRGEGDRGDASRFVSTIARQLADHVPGMDVAIAQALNNDSSLLDRNLKKQFEQLLAVPLRSCSSRTPAEQFIIVIDALDECSNKSHIPTILQLLAGMNDDRGPKLRVFVTSRPETPVNHGFSHIDHEMHKDIKLEVVQVPTIKTDLEIYIREQFRQIKQRDQAESVYSRLPSAWPGDDAIHELVDLANPLFIFAFTTCRYVSESNSARRLQIILDQSHNTTLTGIDKTYLPILNHMLSTFEDFDQERIASNFRKLVGSIVVLATPLSASALSGLLHMTMEEVDELFRHLRSVLSIPTNPTTAVRMLHLSFRDLLVDATKRDLLGPLHIEEKIVHLNLARQCLMRMSQPGALQQDLLEVMLPNTARSAPEGEVIEQRIPQDLAYACTNWIYHIVNADPEEARSIDSLAFLYRHFFHWLEALAWLGRLSDIIVPLQDLRSHLYSFEPEGEASSLYRFVSEASRFVSKYHHLVSAAPLQLYYSAAPFMPIGGISNHVKYSAPGISLHLTAPYQGWGAEAYGMMRNGTPVSAIAVSPDGNLLALGDHDGVLNLLRAASGETMWTRKVSTRPIPTLAFTRSGTCLATTSGQQESDVKLLSTASGEEVLEIAGNGQLIQTLLTGSSNLLGVLTSAQVRLVDVNQVARETTYNLPQDFYRAMTLTANTSYVAAANDKHIIMVWSLLGAGKLQEVATFTGHTERVMCMTFAQDDQLLVSGSQDGSIRTWQLTPNSSISEVWRVGHIYPICGLQAAPDGDTVASASIDGEIKLWSVSEQRMLRVLSGHRWMIEAMSFIQQHTLCSAAADGIVKVWSLQDHVEERRARVLEGGYRVVRVTFADDAKHFATESLTKQLTVWNLDDYGHRGPLDLSGGTCNDQTVMQDGKSMAWWTRKHMLNFYISNNAKMIAPAVSLDNQLFAWVDDKHAIIVADITTQAVLARIQGLQDLDQVAIIRLAISPDDQKVAVALFGNHVRIFSIPDGKHLYSNTLHKTLYIAALTFTHGCQVIEARLIDRTGAGTFSKSWNIATGAIHAQALSPQDSGTSDPRKLTVQTTRGTISALAESEQSGVLDWSGKAVRYLDQKIITTPEDYNKAVMASRGNTLILAKDSVAIIVVKITDGLKKQIEASILASESGHVLSQADEQAVDEADFSFDEDDEELLVQPTILMSVTPAD